MRTGTCDRCGDPFVDTSPAQKRRFCSDNCRKRHQADTTGRGVCRLCGGETARHEWDHCNACRRWLEARACDLRAEDIVEWWASGLRIADIAKRLRWTVNHTKTEIYKLRERGYDLPYRRSEVGRQNIREATRRWREAA